MKSSGNKIAFREAQAPDLLGGREFRLIGAFLDHAVELGKDEEVDLGLQMFEEACMLEGLQEAQVGTFGLDCTLTPNEVVEMKNNISRKMIDKTYDPVTEIPDIRDSFPGPSYIQ